MKRIILFALGLLMLACGKESSVKPANSSTFVRYFNGGNNDIAVAFTEAPDKGLLILATTQIKSSETAPIQYKIKLIKTDEFGNQVWQRFFPDFSTDTTYYSAGGIHVNSDGTIAIVGTNVPTPAKGGNRQLVIIKTDANGENDVAYTVPSAKDVSGSAITVNSNGEYLVLGLVNDPVANMFLGRLKPSLDSLPRFSLTYGSGTASLINKMYLDNTTNILTWGGTVTRNGNPNPAFRFVDVLVNKSSGNEGAILKDPPVGDPVLSIVANDFCKYGNNWAFVGNSKPALGTSDIMYQQVDPTNGFVVKSTTVPVDGTPQNEVGNAICTLKDGGLLLLGTVNSTNGFGRGLGDYYLIKIDAFGTPLFKLPYGSIFDDQGVAVMQASDDGYLVLGTTNLANLKTIMLMKTDKSGKIQ